MSGRLHTALLLLALPALGVAQTDLLAEALIWRVASCAWPGKTSALPTRVQHGSHSTRPKPTNVSALPKANWHLPMRWCTWPWPPSRTRPTSRIMPLAAFVSGDGSRPVPVHLRNAPTRLMKNLGYGANYRYAHDEADAYAAGENYFPEGMPAIEWYRPVARGLEIRIGEKLEQLRAFDRQARNKKD